MHSFIGGSEVLAFWLSDAFCTPVNCNGVKCAFVRFDGFSWNHLTQPCSSGDVLGVMLASLEAIEARSSLANAALESDFIDCALIVHCAKTASVLTVK